MCRGNIMEPQTPFFDLPARFLGILTKESEDKMKKVWICGDSILRGVVWSADRGRYVTTGELDWPALEDKFHISISNKCRFGYTLEKGMGHLFSALERGETCDIAMLELGGNDSDFCWAEISAAPKEEHLPQTVPLAYEKRYRRAIRELREKGIFPVLCNVIPVCSGLYLDWVSRSGLSKENILEWLGDEDAIFRYQAQYSAIVDKVAKEEGCPLIDLRSAFLSAPRMEDCFSLDGIHPSTKGQQLIFDTLLGIPESLFAEKAGQSA